MTSIDMHAAAGAESNPRSPPAAKRAISIVEPGWMEMSADNKASPAQRRGALSTGGQ